MKKFLLYMLLLTNSYCVTIPRVAIITPFKCDDPVKDFLKEISTHDYFEKTDLFFISNDASEKELQVIKQYQYTFRNIKCLLGTPAQSISSLFNRAIESTNCALITFLRVEDYRDPQMFKAQLKALSDDASIDVVYCDFHTSYSANTPTNLADNWYLNELPEFHTRYLYRDLPGPHPMWRKSLHEKCGYLKEDFTFHYLWEFWNRCGKEGILFKKVKGAPGTYFFNYFDQKKILFNQDDFQKSYDEEKYIKNEYGHLWSSVDYTQKPFVIITPSYNNKDWYKRNLDSILFQNYENYRIIYIDDCSPDGTGALVKEYVQEIGKEDKISIIVNQKNQGALANIYEAVHSCKPEEICVIIDGDDAAAHNDVLTFLNRTYQDPNVWLTYGQFEWFPARIPGFSFQIPNWVIDNNGIREYRWITTHLRTFYAGLFQKIKKEDLLYEETFYKAAWDLGMMYPMVEMAAYHTKFIPEILYSYNTANQINDNKVRADLQGKIDCYIRAKERYQPIKHWND